MMRRNGTIGKDVEDEEYDDLLPYKFELSQNYPNPFNPVTTIEYSLPRRSHVTVEIHNVLGQKVRTLVAGIQNAGYQSIQWDGRDDKGNVLPSGVYIYRLEAGKSSQSNKMLLIR